MKDSTIAGELATKAATDKTFRSVCKWFSERQRTRFEITLRYLRLKLETEGVNNPRQAAEDILKFLASLNLGKLELHSNGRIKSLTNIKYRLQSIGAVALQKQQEFESVKPKHTFQDITAIQESVHAKDFITPITTHITEEVANDIVMPPVRATQYPSFLTLIIEGKPVHIPGEIVTPDNMADVITRFKAVYKSRKDKKEYDV